MNVRKLIAPASFARKRRPTRPGYFVFCEKLTGAARFRVPAAADGSLPLEHAASLLAIHCLTRQQSPGDYLVMVGAGGDLSQRVTSRAARLLKSVWAEDAPAPLSRRQQQVLEGVLRNLSNKEIGTLLNLSERTVKFHVSTLLAKYRVSDRVSLTRQALGALIPFDYSGLESKLNPNGQDHVEASMTVDRRSRDATTRSLDARNRVVRFPRAQIIA